MRVFWVDVFGRKRSGTEPLADGTTTLEVKSRYGLSTEHELKMLDAIVDAAAGFPGTVVRTALLGHALDPAV
jgi:imidazolonepropionase